VVVFALKNCSFCTKAITALDSVGARYEVLVVSDRPDKEEPGWGHLFPQAGYVID